VAPATLLIYLLIALLNPPPALAHDGVPHTGQPREDAILAEVGFDQRLDAQVPRDLVFQNERGQAIALRSYFGDKPLILALSYYECTMLCPLVFEGLEQSLSALTFDIGKEFDVISVSIDPTETPAIAAAKKAPYIQQYGRSGAANGWHFLTGDHAAIDRLAESIGFRFAYDAEQQQYAHAAGIVVLTPTGKIARYFYGLDYAPQDLRLGLVEASANRIGSPVDQFLLRCYHYDPVTGKYGIAIQVVMKAAGLLTVLLLGGLILMLNRQEKNYGLPTLS